MNDHPGFEDNPQEDTTESYDFLARNDNNRPKPPVQTNLLEDEEVEQSPVVQGGREGESREKYYYTWD